MPAEVLRLFVFARHAESVANAANMLNSNPSQPVVLTARGRTQARALGAQLANLHVDLAVGTRLLRTRQTIDAGALRRLLRRTETVTLVVIHDLALRYIAAAAATSPSPSNGTAFPNAVPYLFDQPAARRAAASLPVLTSSAQSESDR
jgi:phosphohistidine phosphatase SixA